MFGPLPWYHHGKNLPRFQFSVPLPWYHHGKNLKTSKPCFAYCHGITITKTFPAPSFLSRCHGNHRGKNPSTSKPCFASPPPVFCSTAMVSPPWRKPHPLPFFFPTAMVITMAKTYQLQNRVSPTTMVITMAKTFLAPSFLSHCHGNHHGKNPSTSKPCFAHCHGNHHGKNFFRHQFSVQLLW